MVKYFKNLTDFDFFAFSDNLNKEVNNNGAAWNIPLTKVTEADGKFTTYKPYFSAIMNKKTRTSQQVKDHQEQRVIWEDYIEEFANTLIIPNPVISNSTVEALGFNRRNPNGSPRPKIEAEVFAKIEAHASSKMLFICRTNTDSSRASIFKDADEVEVRYAIGTQPANVNACPLKETSTKARFTLELNADDAGKKIYAFLRWRNSSDPQKSGPWTDMLTTVIRS